jgi:DNA-binding transcriptional ArsR family regulator
MSPHPPDLDSTLAALAEPTRRRVVELLRERPLRAGDIAGAFGVSPPAMSRHLRVLRKSGLVEEEELPDDARVRVYRLRAEPFRALEAWIEKMAAFWQNRLDLFKAHAEARAKKTTKEKEKKEGES